MAENEGAGTGKEVFKTWVEGYTTISKMWNDYYLQIYKPWFEATGELLEKAVDLSKNPTANTYKEFYNEWLRIYSNNIDKFQSYNIKSNRELLEKILASTEKSTDLYRSWITEIDENSRKTRELLEESTADISKYKEIYDLWIDTYGKVFDGFLALPMQNLKDIFEIRTGMPDTFADSFIKISRLWQDSYTKFYRPWMESITKLSNKSIDISKGNIAEDDYKEFYSIWLEAYKQTYGKIFDVKAIDTRQSFENFVVSNNIYINLYKSWFTAIEKLTQKIKEISETKSTTDPDMASEYLKLWIKTYEKFFDSFFDNTPTVGPFKEILEPIKTATKIYLDTFSRMIDIWIKFCFLPYTTMK